MTWIVYDSTTGAQVGPFQETTLPDVQPGQQSAIVPQSALASPPRTIWDAASRTFVNAIVDVPTGLILPQGLHGLTPRIVAGQFASLSLSATALPTIAQVSNRIEYFPFIPARDLAVDQINFTQTAAGTAGANCRVGIVGSNEFGQASTLVEQSSDIAIALATEKSWTFATGRRFLRGGMYWIAFRCSANVTLRGVAVAASANIDPGGSTTPNTLVRHTVVTPYGALPPIAPAGGTLTPSIIPNFKFRLMLEG